MRTSEKKRGFTFVEILIAVAVIAILATASLVAFRNVYRASGEKIAVTEIQDALRSARSNTLNAVNDTVYGVHVGTSSVTRFIGSTYVAGNASNTVYTFEAGAYATGTLVTNGIDIVFTRLTGQPSATGTIYILNIDRTNTTTVTIGATGLIE